MRSQKLSHPNTALVTEQIDGRSLALVEAPLAKSGLELKDIGCKPLVKREQFFGAGQYWELMPVQNDPDYLGMRLHVPGEVLDYLTEIAEAGVRFDGLWIAHERHPEKSLAIIRPVEGMITPRSFARSIARTLGFGDLSQTIKNIGARLDPVLFGVVTADGRLEEGQLARWWVIAAWDEQP